jgi:DNA-binding CsgD family transcriptional regulator
LPHIGAHRVHGGIQVCLGRRLLIRSMTRAELDVVRLVSEGLGSKDVAARHG